jgi:hypothetical protein
MAEVPPGFESRQLFVDGVRATRARSEGGLIDPTPYSEGDNAIGYTSGNTEFLAYAHPEDLEFVFHEQWTNPRNRVATVEPVADEPGRVKITMLQPGWSYVTNKGGTSATVPVYYENALELLDEPGEWYLDKHAGKLYYKPRVWEDIHTAEMTMPKLEELVIVAGSSYDHMVRNIEFNGLTFADTTWLRPGTELGHPDAQNNHIRERGKPDRLPDAAVTVKRAAAIHFTGNSFTRLGITGLKMVEGVQNSFITGNRFFDLSGGAINVGEPDFNDVNNTNPSDPRMLMKNDDILNNYISRCRR